jgi:hypothetical protein
LTQRGTFGKVPADDGQAHDYDADNVGKAWELSGDVVFLANGGDPRGYALVRDCPTPPSTSGCNATDTLLELDVAKLATSTTESVTKSVVGMVVKSDGCDDSADGYGSFFGAAAVGSDIIGFAHNGGIVRIANADGMGCLLATPAATQWAGAGVSTSTWFVAPE